MPSGLFHDYVPELMTALFDACLFLGLAMGFCRWGVVKGRLRQLGHGNSKRQRHIKKLADEIDTLKAQLELVE